MRSEPEHVHGGFVYHISTECRGRKQDQRLDRLAASVYACRWNRTDDPMQLEYHKWRTTLNHEGTHGSGTEIGQSCSLR